MRNRKGTTAPESLIWRLNTTIFAARRQKTLNIFSEKAYRRLFPLFLSYNKVFCKYRVVIRGLNTVDALLADLIAIDDHIPLRDKYKVYDLI